MTAPALVNDPEYRRLHEARGRAWQVLLDAAGATWASDRLCCIDARSPDEALATVAAKRVGSARTRVTLAEIELAEARLAACERRATLVA
jgi:hypothetical protein